jgi:hypothetical protein
MTMKKRVGFTFLAVILFTGILIASCSRDDTNAPSQNPPNTSDTAESTSTEHACGNIFYPLALGNEWIYKIEYDDLSSDQEPSDFVLTVSDVQESTAEISALNYDTGIVTKTQVMCLEGAILNFPLTELNMVFTELDGSLDIKYQSGVFMPSAADFETDGWVISWSTKFIASGILEANYEGENLRATLSESPIEIDWEVISRDEVIQTPAGEFSDVVKIQRNISIEVSSFEAVIEGNAFNVATTLKIQTDMYYSPNIGLVQEKINSATIKLFGIKFPIETSGKMVLTSYSLND